ncbi:hypothetical protein SAB0155 [Staphylococcus aureus RF122]|nr:hypothetical protein SAB0155 [Staphylococcus aureus RF122]
MNLLCSGSYKLATANMCLKIGGSGTEMIFSQNLFRRPTPTCIVCRNWESNFSLLGPRQLAHYCKLTFRQLLYWGPANITLYSLER